MFEILTFRLAVGVDEDAFRVLDERIQTEFAYHRPGCLRRTLGRHDDGRWLVLTVWASPEAAEAARLAFDESPFAAPFASSVVDARTEYFRGIG